MLNQQNVGTINGIPPLTKVTAAWKRAWKRAILSVASMMAYGAACSTSKAWIESVVVALVLVSLAMWGARGRSESARWVSERWAVVVVWLLMVSSIASLMAGMSTHERMTATTGLATLLSSLMAFVIGCCLIGDWKSRPDRRTGWAVALSVALASVVASLIVASRYGWRWN